MYTSEIGFLLTATLGPPVRWWRSVVSPLPCFQQHRCHSVNEPDHEAPKKTWKSTNRLRVNLSIIQFNRPGILQQLAKLDLDVIASLLLQLSFPLFSMTLELCCAKTRAHLPSSDSPPLPWFIVITHFCSLVYCKHHCYIHPLLHHSPTLLTLCCPHLPCPPSLRLGAWTWSSILPHVSLDAIHKFLYSTKCWTCSTGSLPTEDLIANHPFGPAVPEEPLPVCLCNLSCTTLSALGFCSLYFTKRVVIIVPLVP